MHVFGEEVNLRMRFKASIQKLIREGSAAFREQRSSGIILLCAPLSECDHAISVSPSCLLAATLGTKPWVSQRHLAELQAAKLIKENVLIT